MKVYYVLEHRSAAARGQLSRNEAEEARLLRAEGREHAAPVLPPVEVAKFFTWADADAHVGRLPVHGGSRFSVEERTETEEEQHPAHRRPSAWRPAAS